MDFNYVGLEFNNNNLCVVLNELVFYRHLLYIYIYINLNYMYIDINGI